MPNSQGVVLSNQANRSEGKHIHNYSSFKDSLSYRKYNTLRFAEYTPSFEMEGIERDSISVNSHDIIDSLSLNAPFKGSVRKIKESFMVPYMSILPLNWDRIYVQPANGDDVPKDANCVLLDFPSKFSTYWKSLWTLVSTQFTTLYAQASVSKSDLAALYTAILRVLVIGENVYSAGSLLNVCGYKGNAQFEYVNAAVAWTDYDSWFDSIINKIFKDVCYFTVYEPVSGVNVPHYFYGLNTDHKPTNPSIHSSLRAMLSLFRENPDCFFTSSMTLSGLDSADTTFASLYGDLFVNGGTYGEFGLSPDFNLPNSAGSFDTTTDITALNPNTLNLSRILAYQLICAHFYSNSAVDFIYTAELYRQYVKAMGSALYGADLNFTFTWNGMICPYDYLSGYFLERILYIDKSTGTILTLSFNELSSQNTTLFGVWPTIFGFRRSLRFGDYFVGSRPRPLAPINTDVAVNSSMVSVIDITRGIQAQRFANSVMRSRSKIEEYVKGLFGSAPAPDYHNPFFLSRETEVIFGDDVQNTGAAQTQDANSRTANFASGAGRFTFTFHNDDNHPCVYLQIISFDIKRAYTRSVDRQFLHVDRYDMFNPDFQYIGDQPIYGIELGYHNNHIFPDVFGYQGRDMEYKQRFDVACGGFVKNLPGWCLTDQDGSVANPSVVLSPDFIRSYQCEFDQFFLSLAGFSLGSYFHFICITDNNVDAKRAMAVDPQILA